MKRVEVIRRIVACGAVLVREGAEHTLYENPRTKAPLSVPRHREVSKHVSKQLIRDACSDLK